MCRRLERLESPERRGGETSSTLRARVWMMAPLAHRALPRGACAGEHMRLSLPCCRCQSLYISEIERRTESQSETTRDKRITQTLTRNGRQRAKSTAKIHAHHRAQIGTPVHRIKFVRWGQESRARRCHPTHTSDELTSEEENYRVSSQIHRLLTSIHVVRSDHWFIDVRLRLKLHRRHRPCRPPCRSPLRKSPLPFPPSPPEPSSPPRP